MVNFFYKLTNKALAVSGVDVSNQPANYNDACIKLAEIEQERLRVRTARVRIANEQLEWRTNNYRHAVGDGDGRLPSDAIREFFNR